MRKLEPWLLFAVIFLCLSNWHLATTLFTSLSTPTSAYVKVENPALTQYITEKTSVSIPYFYILNSNSLFGTMTGIPNRPTMSLSREMYQTFTDDELHYVVLHETGHYVNHHSLKEAVWQVCSLILIFILLRNLRATSFQKITISLALALFFGIGTIQVARAFEWQADMYAMGRLEKAEDMISATQKLKQAWGGSSDQTLKLKLFYRRIPYSERITFAERYIIPHRAETL